MFFADIWVCPKTRAHDQWVDFTRENLYCVVAIAFFIWRSQTDIRHVTTSPLTVSENNNIDSVLCLTS